MDTEQLPCVFKLCDLRVHLLFLWFCRVEIKSRQFASWTPCFSQGSFLYWSLVTLKVQLRQIVPHESGCTSKLFVPFIFQDIVLWKWSDYCFVFLSRHESCENTKEAAKMSTSFMQNRFSGWLVDLQLTTVSCDWSFRAKNTRWWRHRQKVSNKWDCPGAQECQFWSLRGDSPVGTHWNIAHFHHSLWRRVAWQQMWLLWRQKTWDTVHTGTDP